MAQVTSRSPAEDTSETLTQYYMVIWDGNGVNYHPIDADKTE